MPLISDGAFKSTRPGPYTAATAGKTDDWPYWLVYGGDGINALSGPDGAVLTTRENAEYLAKEWNKRDE